MFKKADCSIPCNIIKSPNYDYRKGRIIDMIILHYTGTKDIASSIQCLTGSNEYGRVSSHYLIDEDGTIYQLVAEKYRAWHAGLSSWGKRKNINSYSIGIELQNKGLVSNKFTPFPDIQMNSLIYLCQDIIARNPIKQEFILGHNDIAPKRKIDPGDAFDWQKLWDNINYLW